MTALETNECLLCHLEFSPVKDRLFCCHGCEVVHTVLSARGELASWEDSALYKEAIRSGMISNPEFQPSTPSSRSFESASLTLVVEEMWCPSCALLIEWVVGAQKGVTHCRVDYATDVATIRYDPKQIGKETILGAISTMGYLPQPFAMSERILSSDLAMRTIVSLFFTLQVMLFSYPLYWKGEHSTFSPYLAGLFSLPVLVLTLPQLFRRLFFSVLLGRLGMEALIVLSALGGFSISTYALFSGSSSIYFDSITALLTFLFIGKCLEQRAKFFAKESLQRLHQSMPRKGRKVLDNGSEAFAPLKEIGVGDTLRALSGEQIVLDGIVAQGEGSCDEALLTGEVYPKRKIPGSTVLGGTILSQGSLLYRVTQPLEGTAYHAMLSMLENDLPRKEEAHSLLDRVASLFVPIVLLIAFSTFFYSPLNALSVLLIACPCAIGIAAPFAESLLLFHLAQKGILVRNRRALSFLGKETLFVFDKTGTLTEGKCSVEKGLERLTEREKRIVKSLASASTHPLAKSIAESLSCEKAPLTKIYEHIGLGMEGEFEGKRYLMGSGTLLKRYGIHVEKSVEVATPVFFTENSSPITTIFLKDRVRAGIPELLERFPIEATLLSGDAEPIVAAVANECSIRHWIAECHPLMKREKIVQWKQEGHIVAMVGDGINDAPALGVADIGIAVFSATDASRQVADILITHTDVGCLLEGRKKAQKMRRIIYQNLLWAFGYNSLGIALACTGLLTPLFAALGMIVSSSFILANSRRIHKGS